MGELSDGQIVARELTKRELSEFFEGEGGRV